MDYAKFLIDDTYTIDYVIYRFKNKINGKVYIGQTTQSVRKRVILHMTDSRSHKKKYKTYFCCALNKYGIENFDFDIIERCLSRSELDERERYWIAHYNSTNKKFGYNIDSGGQKGKQTKPLTEKHKKALLEANLGKHRSDDVKKRLSEVHKNHWKDPEFYKSHIDKFKKIMGWNKQTIYQYDLNGNFIKEWDAICDVKLILYGNKNKGNLSRNIKLNMKKGKLGFTKNNSIWSFISPSRKEDL